MYFFNILKIIRLTAYLDIMIQSLSFVILSYIYQIGQIQMHTGEGPYQCIFWDKYVSNIKSNIQEKIQSNVSNVISLVSMKY